MDTSGHSFLGEQSVLGFPAKTKWLTHQHCVVLICRTFAAFGCQSCFGCPGHSFNWQVPPDSPGSRFLIDTLERTGLCDGSQACHHRTCQSRRRHSQAPLDLPHPRLPRRHLFDDLNSSIYIYILIFHQIRFSAARLSICAEYTRVHAFGDLQIHLSTS